MNFTETGGLKHRRNRKSKNNIRLFFRVAVLFLSFPYGETVETRQQSRNRNKATTKPPEATRTTTTIAPLPSTTRTTTTTTLPPNKDQDDDNAPAEQQTTKKTTTSVPPLEQQLDESLVNRINKYNNIQLGECLAYPTLEFRDTLNSMIDLASIAKNKMKTTNAVAIESNTALLIQGTLTTSEIAKDYSNAHRDCHSAGGRLYSPDSDLETVRLILKRQNIIIGTDKIWVDVQYDSQLQTLIYTQTGKEVPDVWSDEGIVEYARIQPNQCATFVASPLTPDNQRFTQTVCTELHKSLCQFPIDPDLPSLNAIRKTAISELGILEPRLTNLHQTFNHLTYRAKCDSIDPDHNLAQDLLLNTPKNLLYQHLAKPNNERAAIPLLPAFIDDLQNLEKFLKSFLSKPVFISRNKQKLCQCKQKTQSVKVNVSTHLPTGFLTTIKQVLTRNQTLPPYPKIFVNGTYPHPGQPTFSDWLGDIAIAVVTGFSLVAGISSIVCTMCRRQENQACCPNRQSNDSDETTSDITEQARTLMDQTTLSVPPPDEIPQNEGFRLFKVIREKFGRKTRTDAATETSDPEAEIEMKNLAVTPPSAPPLETEIPRLPPPPPRNPYLPVKTVKRTYKLQLPVQPPPEIPARPPPRVSFSTDEVTKANTIINAIPKEVTKYEVRKTKTGPRAGASGSQTLPSKLPPGIVGPANRQVYFYTLSEKRPRTSEDSSSSSSSSTSGTSNSSIEIRGLDKATVKRFNESWT